MTVDMAGKRKTLICVGHRLFPAAVKMAFDLDPPDEGTQQPKRHVVLIARWSRSGKWAQLHCQFRKLT